MSDKSHAPDHLPGGFGPEHTERIQPGIAEEAEHLEHAEHGIGKYLIVFVALCVLTGFSFLTYFDFWREQPGEKGRLAVQAVGMLWSPTFSVDSEGHGGIAALGRDVVEPLFMLSVYLLAIVGAFLVPRRFLALVLLLLAYNTLLATVFAGTVRYRAPFDFLLALLAAAALLRGWQLLRDRRASLA